MSNLNPIRRRISLIAFSALAALASATAAQAQPGFFKAFSPDTIGVGSTSMLTFTISNAEVGSPVSNLAFTDTLPVGVTIAAAPGAISTCGAAWTLSAPAGGGTITFSGGTVGANASCIVRVNVTSSTPGVHMNVSGDLTSDAGNSGTATDDLTVDDNLAGFSKSFAPSTVELGGRSTLTFTIDNTTECGECASDIVSLQFTDNLPPGMVVANPANASTDCGTPPVVPTLGATPGSNTVSFSYFGTASFPALAGESVCTVVVDVIGGAVGSLENVSGNLLADTVPVGKAADTLEVTGFDTLLQLAKEFTDDPVAPGGTVHLQFTVTNKSRTDPATGITFSDDLEATLTGLTPTLPPSPDPPCGAGSALGFSAGVLTLTGGNLPAEGSCTFTVALSVPAGATPGTYPNSAGPASGTVGGAPADSNVAGDLLFVVDFPILTKEFTDDPVGAGGTVTLEFTITNPSTSAMSAIAFSDDLWAVLPSATVGLPPSPDPPCGVGSGVGFAAGVLSLTGGSLAASDGMAGGPDTCTFTVGIDIPAGFPAGTYTNTTETISATLDDVMGTPTVVGPPASDDLVVVGAPRLTKEFTDDPPVPPGGMVTLEFTLTHDALAAGAATGIGFTDDLAALVPAIAGLTANLPPAPDPPCGAGSSLTGSAGDTLLTFAGGTLMPGETCTFSVTLDVPAGATSGFHTNTTSAVTATVSGQTVTGDAASDPLLVTGLLFTKEFTDDPVIAGGSATLHFTLDNTSGTAAASSISFTDVLDPDVLPGLTATGLPISACGGTVSTPDLGKTLVFSGGSVAAMASCGFDVTVSVPSAALDGDYGNVTSSLLATIGTAVVLPPAADSLTVDSSLLAMTKEFTDDPVAPGDPVTLRFTLTNTSTTATVTDIAFSDDLDAALSGLAATGATTNTCGGMATSVFPAAVFSYAGGSLGPGASCMIVLTVDVPAAPLAGLPPYVNTTSALAGKVGMLDVTGPAASDVLRIKTVTLAKDFTDDPVLPGDPVTLEFTLTNLSASAVSGLAFSDDLNAVLAGLAATGLPVANVCGTGSQLAGTTFLTFTNGSLAASGSPGDSCTFSVTLAVPAAAGAGAYPNTTSALFQAGVPVGDPAVADLEVLAPATIVIEKVTMPPGGTGFGFTDTIAAPNAFTLDDGGVETFTGLAPGSYTVTETSLPAGWILDDLTCVDPSGGTTTVGPTATIDLAAGETVTCTYTNLQPSLCFTGPVATGAGDATICTSGGGPRCGFSAVSFIDVMGGPPSPGSTPPGIVFPFGLETFTLDNCTPGFTADITWTLPANVPPNTLFWKYGPTAADMTPHWYVYPAMIAGNVITFQVTDGGDGDHDLMVDGSITDPAGPGAPQQNVVEIPTLGTGALALLAALLALGAVAVLRRRRVS